MDDVQAILADLPKMPEEVARGWLAPHAARQGFGWPPPEGGRAEPWSALLAGRPLSWWRAQHWHREELPMELEVMSHATRFQVTRLVAAARAGQDYLAGSLSRIAAARAHLAETGTWPGAAVAYPDSDGLALSDGHHRLAALEMARAEGMAGLKPRHAVWIALTLK